MHPVGGPVLVAVIILVASGGMRLFGGWLRRAVARDWAAGVQGVVGPSIEALNHKVDDLADRQSREHAEVLARLSDVETRVGGVESRVGSLEHGVDDVLVELRRMT